MRRSMRQQMASASGESGAAPGVSGMVPRPAPWTQKPVKASIATRPCLISAARNQPSVSEDAFRLNP